MEFWIDEINSVMLFALAKCEECFRLIGIVRYYGRIEVDSNGVMVCSGIAVTRDGCRTFPYFPF